ncbi:phosphodiesterase [Dietzia sp. CH92]|uniref:phosphodiesterase n=1 Tax=Dietzia sp. CH92 TaxID=3051823 RepID=UPI0028D6FC8F|nr:phosphodiesterase [Dietzia sp. CH92]
MTAFPTQYPDPTHRILHLSDTHFVNARRPLYGAIDCDAQLATLVERLHSSEIRPDAIVLTGDLADRGAEDAYLRLRSALDPVATEYNCPIVWVMGNHDDRRAFRRILRDDVTGEGGPVDHVTMVDGLRIIALDSTVPGVHHGEITPDQLEWLSAELATPAPNGTLLALHHPPVPTHLGLLRAVELRDAHVLESVLAGSDVRGILAGHFHYSVSSTFAGIPVSVVSATCYSQDLLVAPGDSRAQNGGQGFALVDVYPDRVVHAHMPLTEFDTVYAVSAEQLTAMLDPDAVSAVDLLSS